MGQTKHIFTGMNINLCTALFKATHTGTGSYRRPAWTANGIRDKVTTEGSYSAPRFSPMYGRHFPIMSSWSTAVNQCGLANHLSLCCPENGQCERGPTGPFLFSPLFFKDTLSFLSKHPLQIHSKEHRMVIFFFFFYNSSKAVSASYI